MAKHGKNAALRPIFTATEKEKYAKDYGSRKVRTRFWQCNCLQCKYRKIAFEYRRFAVASLSMKARAARPRVV
jgi:ribosomal protein S27E